MLAVILLLTAALSYAGGNSARTAALALNNTFTSKKVNGLSFEETLAAGFFNRAQEIDVSAFKVKYTSSFQYDLQAFLEANPQFFFIHYPVYSYGSNIISIKPQYKTLSKSQQNEQIDAFDTATRDALSLIKDGMSDVEKALAVHDYLVLNCAYTYDSEPSSHVYDAYGALVKHEAVCQGYSSAFNYLINNILDIECHLVSTEDHQWNAIKINGKFYHVDVTWDDPTTGGYDIQGRVYHSNFLVSTQKIEEEHSSNWTPKNIGTFGDEFANAFWTSASNTSIICDNGAAFFFTRDCQLVKYDFSTKTSTVLTTLDTYWNYLGCYAGLVKKGNILIFNSPDQLLVYDLLSNKGPFPVWTLDVELAGGFFFGIWQDGDKMPCRIAQTPYDISETEVIYEDMGWISAETISLDTASVETHIGESFTINATVLSAVDSSCWYNSPCWTSSNPAVASITPSEHEYGKQPFANITILAQGTTTITATLPENGATATCVITATGASVNYSFPLTKGWNLIAPQFLLDNPSMAKLKDNNAFVLDNHSKSYILLNSQTPGLPIWIFSKSIDNNFTLSGWDKNNTNSIESLHAGWNLTSLPAAANTTAWIWSDNVFSISGSIPAGTPFFFWKE